MRHFEQLPCWFNVNHVARQIDAHPEIWNVHPNRTAFDGSPFAGTSDSWLRYRPIDELVTAENFREPHWPVFYPTWDILTELQPIVLSLAANLKATAIGGLLLTRIPAGGRILPHDDRGSWHAAHYRTKVYVPIRANAECVNFCEDESIVMKAGSAYIFDNLKTHSVENNGDIARITAISCFRLD